MAAWRGLFQGAPLACCLVTPAVCLVLGSVHDRRWLVLSMLEAGDGRQAASVLLRTYGPSVLRYLRSPLREEDAVDDAFSL